MQIFRTLGKHKQALRLPSGVLRHNGGRKRKALAQEGVGRVQVLHGPAPLLQRAARRCPGGGSYTTGILPSLRVGSSLSSTGLSRCRGSPCVLLLGCPKSRLSGPCYLWGQVDVGLTLIKDDRVFRTQTSQAHLSHWSSLTKMPIKIQPHPYSVISLGQSLGSKESLVPKWYLFGRRGSYSGPLKGLPWKLMQWQHLTSFVNCSTLSWPLRQHNTMKTAQACPICSLPPLKRACAGLHSHLI